MTVDRSRTRPRRELLNGNLLKSWRRSMGFTQAAAARAMRCSRTSWRAWESGEHKVPFMVGLAMKALAHGLEPYEAIEIEFDISDI